MQPSMQFAHALFDGAHSAVLTKLVRMLTKVAGFDKRYFGEGLAVSFSVRASQSIRRGLSSRLCETVCPLASHLTEPDGSTHNALHSGCSSVPES
jgi:hypothetical protein